MSGEEDEKEFELKDLIVQTLEANGLLSKLKAQIRASVFMALDEADKNTKNIVSQNHSARKALSAHDGRLAASLVREFLEKCNLDFTLSVFDPELNSTVLLDKRDKLVHNLKLNESEISRDLPILVEVLKQHSSSASSLSNSFSKEIKRDTITQPTIDALKHKFDHADQAKRGLIDQEVARKIIHDLFPKFSKNVVDAFLDNELDEKKKIDFQLFLSVFKKWYFSCQNTALDTEPQLAKLKHDELNSSLKSSNREFRNLNGLENESNAKKQSSLGDLPPLFNAAQAKKINQVYKIKENENYEDDFTNSVTTPRTPKFERKTKSARSGIVSDEEIDENLSYIEESSKIDEVTVDQSISTLNGNNEADYIEDVSI